jgi:TonB family protein
MLIANLAAFSAQVACVAALGGALSTLVRITPAAARYQYWRSLLVLCLGLPWLQGRMTPALEAESFGLNTVVSALASVSPAAIGPANDVHVPWFGALTTVLLVGVVLRLAWIALALLRLRCLRAAGRPAPECDLRRTSERLVGARAEMRYVPGLAQPATFGAWRPMILLPESLRNQPPDVQRAVLCHELIHVRRRDWLWVLAEEAVRAALWFHPGIWWLVSRVQRAREEVVDELAVAVTGSRRSYVRALLAFADCAPPAQAQAFARQRHLFQRITLISKESAMSSTRLVVSGVLILLLVGGGTRLATHVFPLTHVAAQELQTAPGPVERRAQPITPENPVPRRLFSVPAVYPPEATSSGVRADVTLRISVDEFGRVAEVRKIDGFVHAPSDPGRGIADAFVTSAATAVRQWQYEAPASGPIAFNVTIAFEPDSDGTLIWQETSLTAGRPVAPAAARTATDPAPPWHAGAVRVGRNITPPVKVKDARPWYPPDALEAKVQGVVILEARVESDGRISHTRILRSIPLLDQAAVDAVRQWEFTPTLLNGQPVPVILTVTINFTLT